MAGNAGDFVCMNGADMNERSDKSTPVVRKMAASSEKAAGEWNTMEVICNGNTIEVFVNGVLQNKGTNVSVSQGSICLQSEGKDIEFRNVFLTLPEQIKMNTNRKKVAFHTLGCKLNFAETSTISRSFPEDKFERVPASSNADIYVINTCSVTDAADRKCRQAIKKFITLSPGAFIAVVGCYAQLKPQEISSIPGVDLVLGTNEKFDIAAYLADSGKRSIAEIHSCDISCSAQLQYLIFSG